MNIIIKVAVVISNSQKEVLLLKEKYHDAVGFKWNLVKGTYDNPQETIEECARREIGEEVGVDIDKITLKRFCHYGDSTSKKILFVFYAIYDGDKKPTIKNNKMNENISELRWFNKKELRKISKDDFISPYVPAILLEKGVNKEVFI